MPNTSYSPSWQKYEIDANNPDNANKAIEASDKFIQEREHEMKVNPKAKEWEEGRKKEWAKAKPGFIKDRQTKEQEALLKPLKALKELGTFVGNIKPMPGFILVEIEVNMQKTTSGIILPDGEDDSNTAKVVEVSDAMGDTPCPVNIGDRILFKRGAAKFGSPGASINLNGTEYRLMRWHEEPEKSDILGIFI